MSSRTVEEFKHLASRATFPSRHDVEAAVIAGELTPAQAEIWAESNGEEPFAGPRRSYDPLDDVYWTLPMTAAWIVWRTPEAVREVVPTRADTWEWETNGGNGFQGLHRAVDWTLTEVWLRQTHHSEHSLIGAPDARNDLHKKLQLAEITATGIKEDLPAPIPPEHWNYLSLDQYGGQPASVNSEGQTKLSYRAVIVPSTQIKTLWPSSFTNNAIGAHPSGQTRASATIPRKQLAIMEIARNAWPPHGIPPQGLSKKARNEIIVSALKQQSPKDRADPKTITKALKRLADEYKESEGFSRIPSDSA